METDKIVESC